MASMVTTRMPWRAQPHCTDRLLFRSGSGSSNGAAAAIRGVLRRGRGRVFQDVVRDQRGQPRTDAHGALKLLADHFRVHRGSRVRAGETAGSPRRAKGADRAGALGLARGSVGLSALGPRSGPLLGITSRGTRVLLRYRITKVLLGLF